MQAPNGRPRRFPPSPFIPGSSSLRLQVPQTQHPETTFPKTHIAKAKCAIVEFAKAESVKA